MKQITPLKQNANKLIFKVALSHVKGILSRVKITPSKRHQPLNFKPLILFSMLLSVSSVSVAAPGAGVKLVDDLVGAYGDATSFMKTKVTDLLDESGIKAAAIQAETTLNDLAEGAVPVIDDLADPYQENAEEAIAKALSKVELSTKILKNITGAGAKKAIDFITNSPLFADADFGISTPAGRIRIYRKGTEVSLCQTTVGPLGSVIITGVSNAKQLCNFPDTRMENSTKSLLAFTYMAAGHTHVRTNFVIVPNLAEDLTTLPAPIDAATYVKTLGGQYVQIRLAGADPKSLTLQAKFEVGVKANYSYVVDVEAEGEAALKIIDLKPIYAAEVIRSTGEVMLNKATALGLDMKAVNLASNAATILKAGINHLSDIESDYKDGFGNVSIDVKLTGGIGFGAWDTALSVISTNSTFNLTAPLFAFFEMDAGLLEEFLNAGLNMADVNLKLGTAILEGKDGALVGYRNDLQTVTTAFIEGVFTELLKLTNQITSIESTFKLAALGDADKESIVLYESGLKLPVGVISTNLQNNPTMLGDAFGAISYLLLAAIDPEVEITEQTWADLEAPIVPGIEFTLLARNPITASLFGFREADLKETIKAIGTIRNILISVVTSSVNESLVDLRTAIDKAVTAVNDAAHDTFIKWLNEAEIVKSISFGANGSIGAEGVAELGASIGVEGKVSGSLFLLLLDNPLYQMPNNPDRPEEKGLLASASMPFDFSLDAGASAGEGVELTVDAGGKVSVNLFELTVKHWDADLPTSALLQVAGFSVLEFEGITKNDASFSGTGYLMLPMGGIVKAYFAVDEFGNITDFVDEFGNVINSTWGGGLELGPLGDYPLISGTLEDDGLHGVINVSLLGTRFNANFILQPSGLLLGRYDGSITISGYQLAAANIYLGENGEFNGHYEGDIDLGGFAAASILDFDNEGISGSSNLNVLGSSLVSDNLMITREGVVSGTFTGNIKAGPHTLSSVSLRTVNGGLVGTATMDLPGVANAEVELRIFAGKVTAIYSGGFMGGLASQASMLITDTGINLSASLNTSQLSAASSQAINLLLSAAGVAEPLLAGAQILVDDLQLLFDIADLALKGVQSTIDKLQADANVAIGVAEQLVTTSQTVLNTAKGTLRYWNTKIKTLDDDYNALSTAGKKLAWLGYKAARTTLVGSRNIAQTAFNLADSALVEAKKELARLKTALNVAIADVKMELQVKYDFASAELSKALNALDNLLSQISVLNMDAASIFSVHSLHFNGGLSKLLSGNSFAVNARLTFLGKQGQIGFTFNPANPTTSLKQIVTSLMAGDIQLSNSDKTPPTILEVTAFAQQAVFNAEDDLLAAKNHRDSQIALLQEGYADLIFYAELVLNNAMFQLSKLEDAIEQAPAILKAGLELGLSAAEKLVANKQQALLQIKNELSGKIQLVQDEYNLANKQLMDAQNYLNSLNAKSNTGQSDGVLIQLIATDNVAVASITYSASGAQIIPETTVAGDLTLILIEAEGITTLSFYATDISGNVSSKTTINTSVDRSAPQIKLEAPINNNATPYNIVITAEDLQGSGISYLAVSASGAQVITESIEFADSIMVSLTTPGITILSITAVDVAGNSTTITHEVNVPEQSETGSGPGNTPENETNVPASKSSGGGSIGLLWMLLATLVLLGRALQSPKN